MIGRGTYATVFRTTDGLAVKKFCRGVESPNISYQKEISLLKTICHKNIIKLLAIASLDEPSSIIFFVMPAMRCDMNKLLLTNHIDYNADDIICGIIQAVTYLHENAIIHRDIKPSNILLHPDGHAVLCDFGLAIRSIKEEAGSTNYNVYTPSYRPLEIILEQNYDQSADIWALGITVWEITNRRYLVNIPNSTNSDEYNPTILAEYIKLFGKPPLSVFPELMGEQALYDIMNDVQIGPPLSGLDRIVMDGIPLSRFLQYDPSKRVKLNRVESNCFDMLNPRSKYAISPAKTITEADRSKYANWILLLTTEKQLFRLSERGYFYAIHILDELLAHNVVTDEGLPIITTVCVRIAEEYTENDHYDIVRYHKFMTSIGYSAFEFGEAKMSILELLDYDMIISTIYDYYTFDKYQPLRDKLLLLLYIATYAKCLRFKYLPHQLYTVCKKVILTDLSDSDADRRRDARYLLDSMSEIENHTEQYHLNSMFLDSIFSSLRELLWAYSGLAAEWASLGWIPRLSPAQIEIEN
jgi:hypothetical protein